MSAILLLSNSSIAYLPFGPHQSIMGMSNNKCPIKEKEEIIYTSHELTTENKCVEAGTWVCVIRYSELSSPVE